MNNSDAPYIFLMIDLDNFKSVNDMYGHGTGDKMLCFFAKQLRETFRKTDIAIRLGGDEFAVYAQPCFNKEAIQNKVEKIIKDYVEEAKNRCPSVSTSVSVAEYTAWSPDLFPVYIRLQMVFYMKSNKAEKGDARYGKYNRKRGF